eukprot:m.147109 g.147109  ORF g.147109 m.147109 type:complete len:53 (-) comp14160_c0_seq7:2380-2538(-)
MALKLVTSTFHGAIKGKSNVPYVLPPYHCGLRALAELAGSVLPASPHQQHRG